MYLQLRLLCWWWTGTWPQFPEDIEYGWHCVISLEDLVVFPELLRQPTAGAGQEVWLCYFKSLGFKGGATTEACVLCYSVFVVCFGPTRGSSQHTWQGLFLRSPLPPPSVFEHGPRPLLFIHNSHRQPPSPQTHSLRPAHHRHTNTCMFNTSKPPGVVVKVRNIQQRVRNTIENR